MADPHDTAPHDTNRGNILFVTIDQLRADVVFGNLAGVVSLPTLDRLRAEGTSFTNHFTVTAPCGPSRASLMTGLYAFNHRSIRNGTPLADHHATLGMELRKQGREPLLFGYGDIAADPTDLEPGDPRLATYELPPPGFREVTEMRFEDMSEWRAHLEAKGYKLPQPQPDRLWDIYRPISPDGSEPKLTDPPLYRAEDSDTAYLTDRVLHHLHARRHQPWTAHVTYIRPHPPFVAPAPWNTLVNPGDVPPPVTDHASHSFRDAWFSKPSQYGLWMGFDGHCDALTAEQVAQLRALYLGLVAEVDHHLGRIITWLDKTGQRDETMIVITSDHGEMLGDQGYWGKDAPFIGSHHIPLIICDPSRRGRAGETVDALTESVDIPATLLAWTGAEPPRAMDGTSLLPFLDTGEHPDGRGTAFTEVDYSNPLKPTRYQTAWNVDDTGANAAILRDARWTYIHFNAGQPPLLFDRSHDPHETNNLANDPAASGEITRLQSAMLDLRMRRADQRLTNVSAGH